MTLRSMLREIGHHPGGGVWMVAQMLAAIASVAYLGTTSDLRLLPDFVPIIGMFLLQLPGSIVVAGAASLLRLPLPAETQSLLRLLAVEWVLTAGLNYGLFIYGIPALSNRLEARWPFERTFFRR